MDDYHYDTILRNIGKRKLFGREDSAIFVEAFLFSDSTRNIFRERVLEPGKITEAISSLKFQDEQPISGLRLLICPDRNIEQKTDLPQPTNEATVNVLPLETRTFETIRNEFKIPKAFLKIYSRRTAAFHTNIIDFNHAEEPLVSTSSATQSFGFVHQTDSNTKAFFSIGGSYSPHSGITSILLCGLHDKDNEIGELKRRLRHCPRLVSVPFLLSMALLDMRFEYLESRIDEVHNSLHRTKFSLGIDSTISLPSHCAPDAEKPTLDIADISKDVTKAISTAASKIYGCEAHMNVMPSLLEAAEACVRLTTGDVRKRRCEAATAMVMSRLKHHTVWLATMNTRAKYLMTRAQGYASTIYSITSQRDNALSLEMARSSNSISADSKSIAYAAARDSTAMKSIALITTVFLPATFTATLFSTSFFNFQAQDNGAIVSKRIWIYVLVSLLLTAVILGAGYPVYMSSMRKGLDDVKDRERKGVDHMKRMEV